MAHGVMSRRWGGCFLWIGWILAGTAGGVHGSLPPPAIPPTKALPAIRLTQWGILWGATALAFLADDGWHHISQSPPQRRHGIGKWAVFGENAWSMGVLAGIYGAGWFQSDPRLQHAAWTGTRAIAWTAGSVLLLKSTIGRRRPYTDSGSHFLEGPTTSPHAWSFPSGHTALAFSWATTLAYTYPQSRLLQGTVYGMAGMVGLSRIYANKHWFSDVLFGGGVGYLITRLIWEKAQYKDPTRNFWRGMPVIVPHRAGLRCYWHGG